MIKTQFPCGMLWLSETDTICGHDGKICGAVKYQDEQFKNHPAGRMHGAQKGHNEGIKRSFATGQRSPRR